MGGDEAGPGRIHVGRRRFRRRGTGDCSAAGWAPPFIAFGVVLVGLVCASSRLFAIGTTMTGVLVIVREISII
jgi:hypothetical protein